jgi:hypothetical protein
MDLASFISGSFARARDYTLRSLEGLTPAEYLWRPSGEANPVAWLLLHIGRTEDSGFTRLEPGAPQLWDHLGLAGTTGLPTTDAARSVGGGWGASEVGAFPYPGAAVMLDYLAQVRARSLAVLDRLDPARYDDQLRPDRPGTVGAYIYGVPQHESSHRGAIEYLRGLYRSAYGG